MLGNTETQNKFNDKSISSTYMYIVQYTDFSYDKPEPHI